MVQQLIVILAICKSLREQIFSSEVVECDWLHLIGLDEFDWHHHGSSQGLGYIMVLWSHNLQFRTSVLKPYQHPSKNKNK
jgi:hypothetical protein